MEESRSAQRRRPSPDEDQPREKAPRTEFEGSEAGPSHSRSPEEGQGPRGRRRQIYEIVQTRPENVTCKQGKSGHPITLKGNYFKLLTAPTWRIYQYHVDFEPNIESRRVRCGLLSEFRDILCGYIFDGTKAFTNTRLRDDCLEVQAVSRRQESIKITIKYVGVISMTEWQSLQVLNLILRRSVEGLKLQLVGRNFYDAVAKVNVRDFNIQLWPGYITSIRQHERDILVCTEISHKVMRTDTCYDILRKCSSEGRDYQESFKRQVIGSTVLTDYNNKTYRIDDVLFDKSAKDTFRCKDVDKSFVDYYYEKYNIRIKDPRQPLLLTYSRRKMGKGNAPTQDTIILIPELCRATGITDSMRANFQLTRAMGDITRLNPDRRIERLLTFNKRLQDQPASMKVLKDWNMQLDRNLVDLRGRVIDPQQIVFLDKKKVSAGDQADWTRHFRDNAMLTTPSRGLYNWFAITPQRNQRECRNFIDCLIRSAGGMQFKIERPREVVLNDDRNSSYLRAIDEVCNQDPQMVFFLVPNNNAERYGTLKKRTCVDRAIPTQVVTSKTANNQKGLMSVATKVAIQMNCKLGCAAWMIDLPLSGLMTIGFDIVKSSRDKSVAFGGLVATMDMKVNATYFSTVAQCHGADECSNNLTVAVASAIKRYKAEHKELPNRIILYRDGIGEGALTQLMEVEVKTLVDQLKASYEKENKEFKFAYIVVSKKINARLFAMNGRNPPPGTVVDDIITLPERYDFYLVSQSVRQGTVSPTGYNVVYSTLGLDPDRLQMLTYKMTHLYYNWSGTTRVPAVCQYAKKLATLVATSLHNIPAQGLQKKLYYL